MLSHSAAIENIVPQALGGYFTNASLENILRRKVARTTTRIVYDLTQITFFSIPALTKLIIYIASQRSKNTLSVGILLPNSMEAANFLTEYAFTSVLLEYGVDIFPEPSQPTPPSDFSASRLQIRLAYHDDYAKYLNALDSFLPFERHQSLTSGQLRDIVLSQLVDNIRRHAHDRLPYVAMTRYGGRHASRADSRYGKWLKSWEQVAQPWERSFLSRLQGAPNPGFIEITLGDMGPGIPSTLRRVPQYANLTSSQALVQAFQWGVTSNIEDRERRLQEWVSLPDSNDQTIALEGTGLFRVREAVKFYQGYLEVRCGSDVLSYDFLSDHRDGKPEISTVGSKSTLARFLGTHFIIRIPSFTATKKYYSTASPDNVGSTDSAPACRYYSLMRYLSLCSDGNLIPCLHKLLDEIDAVDADGDRAVVAIIDFLGVGRVDLSGKLLLYFMKGLALRQSSRLITICAGMSRAQLASISFAAPPEFHIMGKSRPLLVVGTGTRFSVFGSDHQSDKAIEAVLREPVSLSDLDANTREILIENYPLVTCETEVAKSNIPWRELYACLERGASDALGRLIGETDRYFAPTSRVRVFRRYYAEGFVEVEKILREKFSRQILAQWLERKCQVSGVNVIVALGAAMCEIVDSTRPAGVDVLHVLDPNLSSGIPMISRSAGKKVAVLTDVVATGTSVMRIVNRITPVVDNVSVWAIADVRPGNSAADSRILSSLQVEAPFVRPVMLYFEGKPATWTWESIAEVDPARNVLVPSQLTPPEQPLWLPLGFDEGERGRELHNPLVEEVAPRAGAARFGHYEVPGGSHVTHLFDVSALLEGHGDVMATRVLNNLAKYLDRAEVTPGNLIVLAPDYNAGLRRFVDIIAGRLRSTYGSGIRTEFLHFGRLYSDSLVGHTPASTQSTYVILDDCVVSGTTTRRLVDYAYRQGAERIFAYSIINRSDPVDSAFLANLCGYGWGHHKAEVRIHHLSSARIPTYDPWRCPVCRLQNSLFFLHSTLESSDFSQTNVQQEVLKVASGLDCEKIDELIAEGMDSQISIGIPSSDTNRHLEARWLLEMARSYPVSPETVMAAVSRPGAAGFITLIEVLFQEALYFYGDLGSQIRDYLSVPDGSIFAGALMAFAGTETFWEGASAKTLLIWSFSDQKSLLQRIPSLLVEAAGKGLSFSETLIAALLICYDTGDLDLQSELPDILARVLVDHDLDGRSMDLIVRLLGYIRNREDSLSVPGVVSQFKDALAGPYYFAQRSSLLLEAVQMGEATAVVAHLREIAGYFYKHTSAVRAISSGDLFNPPEKQEITAVLDDLLKLLNDINANRIRSDWTIGQLRVTVDRLSAGFFEIRRIFDVLRADFYAVLKHVLEKDPEISNLLQELRVDLTVDNPETDGMVLFRRTELITVLQELFRNLRHGFESTPPAATNRVRIRLRSLHENEFLAVEMFETGPLGHRPSGMGTRLADELITRYGGRFHKVRSLAPDHPVWRENFTKVITMYLVRLPDPQTYTRT